MPRRNDLHRILIIGSGPIVIGQACEFDYSGAQACKALGEEGFEVVLVNSNPATIMTDPELAYRTYIEPLTPEVVAKIIARERPQALLPTLGGQTRLNLAVALAEDGTLDRFGVELIGAKLPAIKKAMKEFRPDCVWFNGTAAEVNAIAIFEIDDGTSPKHRLGGVALANIVALKLLKQLRYFAIAPENRAPVATSPIALHRLYLGEKWCLDATVIATFQPDEIRTEIRSALKERS
jgi:hypothetical protein